MSFEGKKRILILRYRFIGDTILTVPFLRNLRKAEPDAYIAWLVAPGSSDVIKGIPYIDELIYWDPVTIHADSRGTHSTLSDKWRFIRQLRRQHFDKAYILKRSLSSAIIAWLSGASERIGFDTECRGFLLTKKLPYRHDRHEVENFLDVLRVDGIPFVDDHLEAWLSEEERQFAENFLRSTGVSPGEALIAIHPFTATPPRAWHPDNFITLTNKLQEKFSARILIFGGSRDVELARRFRDEITPSPIMVVGETNIRESMAILSLCKLLVCNDSGIMHLAASLRIPLVALFGPQSPVKFGPWGEKCKIIYKGFECSPCKQKFFSECEPSTRMRPACMEAISVDDVFQEVMQLVSKLKEGFHEKK